MVLGRLFGRDEREAQVRALYATIVEQARQPAFYLGCGVPDTVDGRFDLVALHAFLVLHRLKGDHPASADLAQRLVDVLVLDMDQSLRELGAGDLGVGRRVKQMAQGFYGRIAAYEAGLAGPGGELEAALRRNLYGTVAQAESACVETVATYMRREALALERQPLADLAAGRVCFGAAPEAGRTG